MSLGTRAPFRIVAQQGDPVPSLSLQKSGEAQRCEPSHGHPTFHSAEDSQASLPWLGSPFPPTANKMNIWQTALPLASWSRAILLNLFPVFLATQKKINKGNLILTMPGFVHRLGQSSFSDREQCLRQGLVNQVRVPERVLGVRPGHPSTFCHPI